MTPKQLESERAYQREAIPDGWKLVPKQMTSGMFFAWESTKVFDEGKPHERYQAAYRAMLAAAPQPTTEKSSPVEPLAEHSCFCNDNISLQIVSGGASEEGLYGRVMLKVNGEYVDYVKVTQPQVIPLPGVVTTGKPDVIYVTVPIQKSSENEKTEIAILRDLLEQGPANFELDIHCHINKDIYAQLQSLEQRIDYERALYDNVKQQVRDRSSRNLQNAVWRDFIIARIKELEDQK